MRARGRITGVVVALGVALGTTAAADDGPVASLTPPTHGTATTGGSAAVSAGIVPLSGRSTVEITYLTGSSVYVAAGSDEGLVPGTLLRPTDAADDSLVLRAAEATAHRAVCRVVKGDLASLEVGDRLAFSATASLAPGAATIAERPGLLRRAGLRGRVGVRYLATRNRLNDRAEFRQPALDLRLDGPSLYGTGWSLHADVRARRTTRDSADGRDDSVSRTRVYRLAVGWDQPGDRWAVAAGRQVVPELANVSVFDGLSLSFRWERWRVGGFAGTQPDREDYGFSSDVREGGVFGGLRSRPSADRRWSVNAGAVGSYEDSEVNREYVFLQGRYGDSRWNAFLTQEVDVNRDWKKELGESSIEPTSTFASVSFRATDAVSLRAGYDNRRNVRLFRDRVTPETEFDDEFRRGLWLGGHARLGQRLDVGLEARTFGGDGSADADSYTATFGARRLTSRSLSTGLRTTRYENERLEGWLYGLDVSLDLGMRVRLGFQGGVRDDEWLMDDELSDTVTWYGIDLDVSLARRLYLTLSAERSDGDFEEVDQLYLTLAYRF
jgi:hypothetical protein